MDPAPHGPIRTRRLVLTPITAADDAALHALFCDPFVHRHLFDGRPPAAAESAALLASCRAAFHERQLPLCTVRFTDGALAGFCGLKPEPERGVPELVFGLSPRFVGRGLATEAAEACLQHGFERIGLPRIVASADAPNRASLAVLERLGLRRVGSRPGAFGEIHLFEIHAADPRPSAALQGRGRSADPLR